MKNLLNCWNALLDQFTKAEYESTYVPITGRFEKNWVEVTVSQNDSFSSEAPNSSGIPGYGERPTTILVVRNKVPNGKETGDT